MYVGKTIDEVLDDLDARRLWDIFNFFAEEECTEDEEDIDLVS